MQKSARINVGKITGVFGVNGWVKVFSDTDPRTNILSYSPWCLDKDNATKSVKVVAGRSQGKVIVAQLQGITDRDQAELLAGWDISIEPEQLPATDDGEYYWSELTGLKVKTDQGVELGYVDHLMETGANDVLVIKGDRERLIPFLQGRTILNIDLQAGEMQVDWDPDF